MTWTTMILVALAISKLHTIIMDVFAVLVVMHKRGRDTAKAVITDGWRRMSVRPDNIFDFAGMESGNEDLTTIESPLRMYEAPLLEPTSTSRHASDMQMSAEAPEEQLR